MDSHCTQSVLWSDADSRLLLWLIYVLFRYFLHRSWCSRPLLQTISTTATNRCSYTLASSASHINTTQQTQAESCSRSEMLSQFAVRHIHFTMLNAAEKKGAQNTPLLFKCCRTAHQGCRASWIFQVLPVTLTAAQWLSTITAYKFLTLLWSTIQSFSVDKMIKKCPCSGVQAASKISWQHSFEVKAVPLADETQAHLQTISTSRTYLKTWRTPVSRIHSIIKRFCHSL